MTLPGIRVLVIDDSAFNRRTITRILESIPQVSVVGYAINGEEGLRKITDLKPDLITLDLEMPRIDGFTLLRIVMAKQPTPIIVVSSRADDENVFKALELGAVDFVPKPTARSDNQLFNIRDDLIRKVLQCARTDMSKIVKRSAAITPARCEMGAAKLCSSQPRAAGQPHLVLIGSSTGGPPAVQTILSGMKRDYPLMFAVSQHMPSGFTRAFADRLNKFCDLEVIEAKTGERVPPGRVLIAPGGKNLLFRRRSGELVAHVTDPEPDQLYVPSVNAMFNSAVEFSPVPILGVVLTGMGNDGADGVVKIKGHGGQAIAESDESCVVFGMPKAAIATGLVDAVRPLPDICSEILCRTHR